MSEHEDDPTRAIPSTAMIGGRYRLDVLVGRGGTAEVWAATDTSLSRTVALKLVTGAHDESAARAADEARTLAALNHPNLVQVFDAGTDGAGRPWVVMEYVDGDTLGDAMRKGPLPVATITDIGIAVSDALAYVHSTGLVHRDVKPGNILLGRTPKLTDFGIARLVDAAKVTSTGLMVGTAAYLAPEQVQGRTVGPAADVYALGLVLLETLTGIREYDGPPVEAAMARLSRPPSVPTTLPTGWAGLIVAMTALEPEQRPTAAQVATALRDLQAGSPITTVIAPPTVVAAQQTSVLPRTTAEPVPAAPVRTSSGKGWWVAIGLAAILLGIGGGIVLSQNGKATPHEIPAVNQDSPNEIKGPLNNVVDEVKKQ